MSLGTVDAAKLDINRVIQRTIEVLRRLWRSLLQPALLLLYLPGVIVGALSPHDVRPFEMTPPFHSAWPLLGLLALIPYAVFQGGLIRLALADLNAEAVSAGEAMRVGRERLWPLFGLYILIGLGVGLLAILLIVPGVIAALAWCVAPAVLVEERRPVLECFGRSAELTRGSRLNIFGVGLTFLVFEIIASLAVGLVSLPFPGLFAHALVWPLYSAAVGVVGGVLVAVIYNELRWLAEDRAALASSAAL